MHNFTWNRFPIKNLLIDSLLTPIVESTYLSATYVQLCFLSILMILHRWLVGAVFPSFLYECFSGAVLWHSSKFFFGFIMEIPSDENVAQFQADVQRTLSSMSFILLNIRKCKYELVTVCTWLRLFCNILCVLMIAIGHQCLFVFIILQYLGFLKFCIVDFLSLIFRYFHFCKPIAESRIFLSTCVAFFYWK